MAEQDRSEPANTLRERAGASRVKLWFLIEARRPVVAGVWFSTVFLALAVTGSLYPNATQLLQSGDPIETAFQSFIGATITGVTLVLTLNQLVLSQELGAVGDQRERMEGAMQFRRDVESVLELPVSPPEPAAFLRAIIDAVEQRARDLGDAVGPDAPDDFRDEVDELVEEITGNAETVRNQLTDAQFGTFDVLSAALNFNYSSKIYRVRRVQTEYDETASEEQAAALDDLLDALELFGPAREHFKTLYVQWELINLSRVIVVAAIPSLVMAVFMLFYYDATTMTGFAFGLSIPVLVVSAAVAVALLPFVILIAYVLRIATVTKWTLSIGSFTLRQTAREEESQS